MYQNLKRYRKLLPILILLFLVAVFFGKALFPPAGSILFGGDLNDQFYFWKSFFAENIKNGIIPFWNPYSFSGTPFLAHPSTAAFYPFNIIFILLPLNWAFSVYLYIHVAMASIFMYLLLRRYTDIISSIASGVVFGLSGLIAARIYSGHIDIISTLVWVPVVFASVIEAIKTCKRKNIFLAILFLTLQILAGYQAIIIFTLELIIIYECVVTLIGHQEKKPATNIGRKILTLVFIILISYGISAVQILPTLEFVRNSIRGGGLPYDSLTWGSYTPDLFLTFIQPFKYGNPFPESLSYNGPGPNFFELSYFAGLIPLFLFLGFTVYQFILILRNKGVEKAFLGLLTALIFFALAAAGNNTPLHRFLYQIFPPYRLFRFPSQHLMMVVFIVSFMSGLALSLFKNTIPRLVILVLITVELVSFDSKFIHLQKIPTDNFDHNLTSIFVKYPEIARLLPDYTVVSPVRSAMDFESSMYYKVQTTSGYNPIFLDSYYHFIDLLNKNSTSSISQYNVEIPPPDPQSKYIDFLNVKYILTDKNFDAIKNQFSDKYRLKLEGNTYRLYENISFLPRYFIVDTAKVYSTPQALENAILLGNLDLKNSVGLDKTNLPAEFSQKSNCSSDAVKNVEVTDYSINSVKLKTDSSCDGFLSSSEIYYPGWQAKIDGKIVPLYMSNTAFRAIFLVRGKHLVEFYYQPLVYYIGGFITLISLFIALVMVRKYYAK